MEGQKDLMFIRGVLASNFLLTGQVMDWQFACCRKTESVGHERKEDMDMVAIKEKIGESCRYVTQLNLPAFVFCTEIE